jgi:glycosyltransferase involved in cell wall biosynthesis
MMQGEITTSVDTYCPICGEMKPVYQFLVHKFLVVKCPGCGLVSVQSGTDSIALYYDYLGNNNDLDPSLFWVDSKTEQEATIYYLRIIKQNLGLKPRLLIVAPPDHMVIKEAEYQGCDVGQIVSSQDILEISLDSGYDGAIILFQLEKSSDPIRLLEKVSSALKEKGYLLVVTPSLDSFSARFFKYQWTEWRPENRYYFNNSTIQSLLWKCGFEQVRLEQDHRRYTLDHIHQRAKLFPKTVVTKTINLLYHLLPRPLTKLRIPLPTSGIVLTARKGIKRQKPLCSIILPVYDEHQTFSLLMESLLKKRLVGMDKEIIIIESNSSDGSRESVLQYQQNSEVKIVLQDKARGKGNAVREGFEHATGDVILIQDADLEYDINDYQALLDPVIGFKALFVLGARHGGSWKMRQFDDQQGIARIMNLGHVFFTTLINILYHQKMKDPFTMYKVFRRDCLYNLKLECNRFDFDHELVIKLIRKGYSPLEIPVNYRSRSFKQGKKVRIFQDPLMWLWVDIKYRFTSIYSYQTKINYEIEEWD